nr:unnamed protein product [Callosobruchus analis]
MRQRNETAAAALAAQDGNRVRKMAAGKTYTLRKNLHLNVILLHDSKKHKCVGGTESPCLTLFFSKINIIFVASKDAQKVCVCAPLGLYATGLRKPTMLLVYAVVLTVVVVLEIVLASVLIVQGKGKVPEAIRNEDERFEITLKAKKIESLSTGFKNTTNAVELMVQTTGVKGTSLFPLLV